MIAEKTITICGKEVRMRYCAATETGYEIMTGKKMDVFSPVIGQDDEGNDIIKEQAKATTQDYLLLAVAAIVAAYKRVDQEPPISDADILYDASPEEVTEILTTVVLLRVEWYKVPDVVKPDMKPDTKGRKSKNAQPPTTSSKK